MARRPLPEDQRPMKGCVRVSPATGDALSRYALRQGVSTYALAGRILERVFAIERNVLAIKPYLTDKPTDACYSARQSSSTLSAVLGESPSRRADRIAEPSSPR